MKIATYNVNGIRAAIRKGLLDWIAEKDYDILCFQETKSHHDQVDAQIFSDLGYHAYWHSAERKGYSGVLTLTKTKPDQIVEGMNIHKYDREGRVLRTDFDDWTVLNCYFPSGSSSELRHDFKMTFLRTFKRWINKHLEERPNTILLGDYNIVHQDMDIHNPKRKDNPSGFRPEERRWLDRLFKNAFTDSFRFKYEDKTEFSWWSYRAGSRKKNLGWRIDYIAVTDSLKSKIEAAGHHNEAMHSDHCPVWMEIKL